MLFYSKSNKKLQMVEILLYIKYLVILLFCHDDIK